MGAKRLRGKAQETEGKGVYEKEKRGHLRLLEKKKGGEVGENKMERKEGLEQTPPTDTTPATRITQNEEPSGSQQSGKDDKARRSEEREENNDPTWKTASEVS